MGLFKRNKKETTFEPSPIPQDYSYLTNRNDMKNEDDLKAEAKEKYWSSDKLIFSDQESRFIEKLANAMSEEEIKNTEINRMSDKCLNFTYKGMQFGRIKITKRTHWMQLLTGLTDVSVIEGDTDYFIAAIPIWITYIRKELIE